MAASMAPLAMLWPRIGREHLPHIASGAKLLAGERGPDEIAQHQPGGFDGLGRIEGTLAGHALAPAGHAIDVHFDQKNAPDGGPAKAGLKGPHQRHLNFAQRGFAQAHGKNILTVT